MNCTDLTIEDLAEVIRPHNERILAEHRADALESQLKAANIIIAETNTVLATVHSSLCAARDFIRDTMPESAAYEIIEAIAMIEGRRK